MSPTRVPTPPGPVQSVGRPLPHLVAHGSTNKYRPVSSSKASGEHRQEAHPRGIRPLYHGDDVDDNGYREGNGQPAAGFSEPICSSSTTLFCDPPRFTTFEPSGGGQLGVSIPDCLAYSAFNRCQPPIFMVSAPTKRPIGSPARSRSRTSKQMYQPRGAPRDEAAIDVVPQRQARTAAAKGFEFPPDIVGTPVVLKQLGSVGSRHRGSRHCCFGTCGAGAPPW